jgi:hypothetical protein
MLKKYIRSLNKQYCPLVLSLKLDEDEPVIIRKHRSSAVPESPKNSEIYFRAREIFSRARRHRPARAAAII